ncbi:YhgE/Pip family protein [Lactobacillus mulieris]|uniref:YhgE/Pip family protein n=1 Tax=Lactobacillus mulieris TaxID=2508708 RepID=UPI002244049A|nr:YhgE/Pip family protein [Lactobacillus mulieris]MCW8124697.1 YhgE/Pip family protein [Lactobacillus mulieris]MDK7327760.1 YhgE/Pip family protein [Lactobacillus mulieris]
MEKVNKWLKNPSFLKLIMISVAVLAPIFYSLSFIKSVWDPYAGAKNLPIAVVNEDKAVKYNKKTLAVGDQTVAQLKKNHDLKWVFVNENAAREGLKNREFYTVVTIPSDFSKNAATVMSKKPKQMQLKYKTNDSLNYLAETMSDVGIKQLNTMIRSAVTKAYATAMFSQLKTLGAGMNKAASGAQQISDGTVTLTNGTKQYTAAVSQINDGIQTLKVSVTPLKAGASQLASGSSTLANGVSQYTAGVAKLNSGVNTLNSKSGDLLTGMNTFNSGLTKFTAGNAQLNTGLNTLSTNSAALRAGATSLQSASNQFGLLNNGASQVASGVQTFNNNLQSSNIVSSLTQALSMQEQVTSLEKQLSTVQSLLKQLSGIDVNALTTAVDKLQNQAFTTAVDMGNLYTSLDDNQKISDDADQINSLLNSDKTLSSDTKAKLANLATEIKSKANDSTTQINSANNSWGNLLGVMLDTQSTLQPQIDTVQSLSKQLPALQSTMTQAQSLLTQTDTLLAALKKNQGLLTAMPTPLASLQSATSQIAAGTQKLADSTGSINTLVNGINQYTNGVDTAANGAAQLASNSDRLISGFKLLYDGTNQYTQGVSQVKTGTATLVSNNTTLNNGASQLSTALSSLNSQVPSLIDGVNKLATGTQTLNGNSNKLVNGMTKISSGSSQLATQLSNGADKVNSNIGTTNNAEMFATPTSLQHTSTSKVPNYGHALAPFAMATGLFIGVLIFTLEFPANRRRKAPKDAIRVLNDEFKRAVSVSLAMVVILNVIMMLSGLQVDHVLDLFWICLVYTLAQMAIMQFLTLIMGRLGTIIGLLLFIASIGGAGGMFPMQVTNSFFNAIHPLLPMTYAINGLRQAITGGLGNSYASINALVLLGVAVLFYLLFLLAASTLIKKEVLEVESKQITQEI